MNLIEATVYRKDQMILTIDQHDSFNPILCHMLATAGEPRAAPFQVRSVLVEEIDDDVLHLVQNGQVTRIVWGSAVGSPGSLQNLASRQAFARILDAAQEFTVPLLALGTASIFLGLEHGASYEPRETPAPGITTRLIHSSEGLFAGLQPEFSVTEFQSYQLSEPLPETLGTLARTPDGRQLGFQVAEHPLWGLSFQPESIGTEAGQQLLKNFVQRGLKIPALAEQSSSKREKQGNNAEVFIRSFEGKLDLEQTFARLQEGHPAAFWLDSADADLENGQGSYSILGNTNGSLSQVVRWDIDKSHLQIWSDAEETTSNQQFFEYLEDHQWELDLRISAGDPYQPVFQGGWVGYMGYEALLSAEDSIVENSPEPDAYWIRPQSFIRYHHPTHTAELIAVADEKLLDSLEKALVPALAVSFQEQPTSDKNPAGEWRLSSLEYEERVRSIQELIRSGDVSEICLTDTYVGSSSQDGFNLYVQLRRTNPAPYAAYFRFNTFSDELEVLSASPERFVTVDSQGRVETKPIKGTIARFADESKDQTQAKELSSDPKTFAEHLMIVDLLRADLAKVAQAGTVNVPVLMGIESFATVHQMVSTVRAQLDEGIRLSELFNAVFPGGSMTGLPKQDAVEKLRDLEAGPRGIYSGAIGWWDAHRAADFSVIIRTIIKNGEEINIGAGGAVVLDSDPAAENAEKQLKAQALLDILE